MPSSRVLVSRRLHGPFWEDGELRLDRVLAERWVVRRATLGGFVIDERVSAAIGRGLPAARQRMTFVLEGRTTIIGARGDVRELGPGDVCLRPRIDVGIERASGATLEIDVEPDAPHFVWESGRLGPAARAALVALADQTRDAQRGALGGFRRALSTARAALAAEGLGAALPDPGTEPASRLDDAEQRFMTALDGALSTLGSAPALVDLERALACDRRTVVRRTHAVHGRHALHGLHGTDFRSVRDFYRLLIACILLSHRDATTDAVARAVGYGSPAALCHTFQRVGLGAPQTIRARARES